MTISDDREIVKRLRRYLAKTVINTYILYTIFREIARKELSILEFINNYNYYINRIDNIN